MTTTAPTVLITGTSTGIGFHTAIAAAKAGFMVIATMRDVSRADALRRSAPSNCSRSTSFGHRWRSTSSA